MIFINNRVAALNHFLYDRFISAPEYRVWRHITYWAFHITAWGIFWVIMGHQQTVPLSMFKMLLWVPAFILFGYPLAYIAVPRLLLQGRLWQFALLVIAWGAAGLFINTGFKLYVYFPVHDALGLSYNPNPAGFTPHSYLCMTTSAASPVMIRFFKSWKGKQQEWLQVQQEKVAAELHLLQAQLHPHFLFNTLNNIYAFALEQSAQTPRLILKLSSLLHYILHECSTEVVPLDKELAVMLDYIDLEKERYGDKIDISIRMEGATEGRHITPLLLLPFLENAFKHGASQQLDKPWLTMDICCRDEMFRCRIVNSKNEQVPFSNNGVGIQNVRSRLKLLYPGKHSVELRDEGNYFTATLILQLPAAAAPVRHIFSHQPIQHTAHENPLLAHR